MTWHENRWCGAHRAAYAVANNLPLAALRGVVIRHHCDNKLCINPAHLAAGTHAENSADIVSRGRQAVPPTLTMEQAREIRATYQPGTRWQPSPTGQPQLAKKYGVPQSVISQIIRNVTYKERV